MSGESLWFVYPDRRYLFVAIGRFIIGEVEAVSPVAAKLKPGAVWVRQTGANPAEMYQTGEPQEFFPVPCDAVYFHDLQSIDRWEHPVPKA